MTENPTQEINPFSMGEIERIHKLMEEIEWTPTLEDVSIDLRKWHREAIKHYERVTWQLLKTTERLNTVLPMAEKVKAERDALEEQTQKYNQETQMKRDNEWTKTYDEATQRLTKRAEKAEAERDVWKSKFDVHDECLQNEIGRRQDAEEERDIFRDRKVELEIENEKINKKIDESFKEVSKIRDNETRWRKKAEKTEDELEALKKRGKQEYTVIKQLRIIRGLAEARYIDAEDRLVKAQGVITFYESHFGSKESIIKQIKEALVSAVEGKS